MYDHVVGGLTNQGGMLTFRTLARSERSLSTPGADGKFSCLCGMALGEAGK